MCSHLQCPKCGANIEDEHMAERIADVQIETMTKTVEKLEERHFQDLMHAVRAMPRFPALQDGDPMTPEDVNVLRHITALALFEVAL